MVGRMACPRRISRFAHENGSGGQDPEVAFANWWPLSWPSAAMVGGIARPLRISRFAHENGSGVQDPVEGSAKRGTPLKTIITASRADGPAGRRVRGQCSRHGPWSSARTRESLWQGVPSARPMYSSPFMQKALAGLRRSCWVGWHARGGSPASSMRMGRACRTKWKVPPSAEPL
jgi:hypothetical protein